MHVKDYYKTLNISLLFWHQSFTNIFTSKLILPMVLPVNRWYGKSSKFTTLLHSVSKRSILKESTLLYCRKMYPCMKIYAHYFLLLQGVLQIGPTSARKDDPCICAPVLIGGYKRQRFSQTKLIGS